MIVDMSFGTRERMFKVSLGTMRTSCMAVALGLIVLIVGFIVAWLSGHGYLPFLPQTVVMLTMIFFCLTMLLSTTSAMAGTDYIVRQDLSSIPDTPPDDVFSRVIRDSVSGEERIIQAHPNSSIHEVLRDDWPFRKKISDDWYLIDEDGNDITNWPISNWDGVAILRYRDQDIY
ncbi:MAG: hypothetical protein ACFFE1_03625 [Candidatus Thorarchaeota archaeon]